MIKKALDILKNDWQFKLFYIALIIVVLLIAITSFYNSDYTLHLPPKDLFANITFGVTIGFGIIFYFIFKYAEKKNLKLEYLYLFLVIPLGILYCIANPLGKVPDEDQHARKAAVISYGDFFSTEKDDAGVPVADFNAKFIGIVSRDITSYEEAFSNIATDETNVTANLEYSMATYAPICHMPQAFGMFITRIFGAGVAFQCYTARIVNLSVAITLIFFAIKLIPFKKKIVLFLGLLPITISEFASMSSDALTISSCIFYISYILYLKYDENKTKINKVDITVLAIFSLIVSLCKIVYVPLCLLLFILPKEKFSSKKAKYISTISIFVASLFINLAWLIYASGFLVEVNPGVNSSEQVKYILTHPISYLLVLFRTIHIYNQTFILSLCGEGLGHYNAQASVLFVFPCLVVFALLFFTNEYEDKDRKGFDFLTKLIFLFIFVVIVLLIYTSLYVAWTQYKAPIILGVQSRYFLPVLLLTAVFFDIKKLFFNIELKNNKFLLAFMLFFNLNALSCLSYTYIFKYIIEYYVK